MELINLTPHVINLSLSDGTLLEIPSSGEARVDTEDPQFLQIPGIPVPVTTPIRYGEVYGLPEFSFDRENPKFYIVSRQVADAIVRDWDKSEHSSRYPDDLLVPGTGPKDDPIRNAAKQIVAVRILSQVG